MQERAQSLRSRPLPAIVHYPKASGNSGIQRLRAEPPRPGSPARIQPHPTNRDAGSFMSCERASRDLSRLRRSACQSPVQAARGAAGLL